MLKNKLSYSLLSALETLCKLLSSATICVIETPTLTVSHCSGLNVADSMEVECF